MFSAGTHLSVSKMKSLIFIVSCLPFVLTNLQTDGFKGLSGCKNGWVSTNLPFSSCRTKSIIECIAVFARTHGCYSVNACFKKDRKVTCDIIGDTVTGCPNLAAKEDCRHLQHKDGVALRVNNPCFNGGTWDGSVCHCVWGFAGVLCERLVRGCREAYELGVRGLGFYKIQPLGSSVAYTVYCNCGIYAGGTIWVFRRIVPPPSSCPPINYNRTFEDYKNGFGDFNCEYFLGLETMYQLTKYAIYQWNIYNVVDDPVGATSVQIENAVLKSEANNYEVSFVREFQGPWEKGDEAFDESETSRRFCTWDRDCGGCAKTVGGGWWFTSTCKGGVLTALQSQMVWPVSGVGVTIKEAFLNMDLHGYR